MRRPGHKRPIAGRATKNVRWDLQPEPSATAHAQAECAGRLAACSEQLAGWEFDTRSPRFAEVGTGYQTCASTAQPLVGAVVKTGETAVVLNRR